MLTIDATQGVVPVVRTGDDPSACDVNVVSQSDAVPFGVRRSSSAAPVAVCVTPARRPS